MKHDSLQRAVPRPAKAIDASPTASEKEALALNHVATAFGLHERRAPETAADPQYHAKVTQTAARLFLQKKRAQLEALA
eukprot:1300910-Alexandrium_andersonii.AAC.1